MVRLKINSVLVLCTANVCRSPIGEHLLRRFLPEIKVHSAGIFGLVGQPANPTAIEVASRHGLYLTSHIARRFNPIMIRQYDLILTMEPWHTEWINVLAPEVRGKNLLFGHWLNRKKIPDPYRKNHEEFEKVYSLLERASQEWAIRIN
ncbi:protein tyrosine phosphatase [uncultured Enterobacter sp.]|uniref:arsenate reductase/protein-tyrosine-phosphatase family protein n=1 Tax=uncultured Enterobacter sp. TaxID=238202 RepID=UPI0025F5B3C5|nr:protein tyrosine phosphatase [uncultured Enterobacter sp.]